MGFRPRHHKQRKGGRDQAIAGINRRPCDPRIIPPLLQRAKQRVQNSRKQGQSNGQPMSSGRSHHGKEGGCHMCLGVPSDQGIGEILRIKGGKVVNLLAHANGMNGQTELVGERHQHPAPRCAI